MQFHEILDHGSFKKNFFSFFVFTLANKYTTADIQKNVEGMEQPAIDPLRFD